jgi:hypothetical protein
MHLFFCPSLTEEVRRWITAMEEFAFEHGCDEVVGKDG